MGKSGEKLEKVGKKWEQMVKSGEKWRKVVKSVEKSGEKVEKKWGNLFTKWMAAAIFHDRKSLSIAFLAISDQYATFFFI